MILEKSVYNNISKSKILSAKLNVSIMEKIKDLELLDELTRNSKLSKEDAEEISKLIKEEIARRLIH